MKDRWMELCELAATEEDLVKFRTILQELHSLLDGESPEELPLQSIESAEPGSNNTQLPSDHDIAA